MIILKKGLWPRRTTPRMTCGAALVAMLVAGACSEDDPDVALPSTSPPAAPTASASPTSVEDAVKHSYSQYLVVLPQATQEPDAQRRRQMLGQYVTQPLLDAVLSNIEKLRAQHQTSTGHMIVRIRKVQVEGGQATVWDCQDSTNALVKDTRTGKVLSRGTPNDHLKATLTRGSDGQWRINRFTPLGRC